MAGFGGFGGQGSVGQSRAQSCGIRTPPCLCLTGSARLITLGILAGRGHRQAGFGACCSPGQDCWLSRAAKIKLQQSHRAGEHLTAEQEAWGPARC